MRKEEITSLMNEIKECGHRWKALYFAWKVSYQLEEKMQSPLWNEPYTVSLPASKYKSHTFPSMKYCYELLRSRDGEIALSHTITMLTLLENLCKRMNAVYFREKGFSFFRKDDLIRFMRKHEFLLENEEADFYLAAKTRDCVVHQNHQANSAWIKAFNKARNATPLVKRTRNLYGLLPLPEIERWHEMLLRINSRIESKIPQSEESWPDLGFMGQNG